MRCQWLQTIGIIGVLSITSSGSAEELLLGQYLDQVQNQNAALAAARTGAEAARARLKERNLLTTPYFLAEGQTAGDKSPSLEPMYYGDSRRQNQWMLGLEQQTGFGLNWRLSHQTTVSGVSGADPMFVPWDEYYATKTGLELSQDIWRNAFGREVLATADALEAQSQARLLENEYQVKQMLVEAEKNYWKLSLAREVVRIQKELLERAQRLAAWINGRVDLKLQDKSDLMQAQSQWEARRLELAAAEDQERMAGRGFNLLRGNSLAAVAENLILPTAAEMAVPSLPEQAPKRKDIRALEWNEQMASQDAHRKKETLTPELKARAGYYLNGLDQKYSPAFTEAQKPEYAAYMVGISLRLPLDYFSRRDVQSGYDREGEAITQLRKQRTLEVEGEWQEIRRQLQDDNNRWQVACRLEDLQKSKADYERLRLKRGNTITYQVLQFEQDWGQSQLARVSMEAAILELKARVKLFEE